MLHFSLHRHLARAAMASDMDLKTARKYIKSSVLPSQARLPRDWRTRPDPFAEHWPDIEVHLKELPALEAKTLFDMLRDKYPGRYEPGQLRTLQRHIQRWRALAGPSKEIMFSQLHRPGEAAQTDFTHAVELGVMIAGQLFVHMLCVLVLPYSNWQWATVCLSESMAAIRKGVQRALFQLCRVPMYHQTDNSCAATHQIGGGADVFIKEEGRRPFNKDYLALMRHFGMTPRTTEIGAKEQNGDVEASNGALKRRLLQALLLRGSRDFESVAAYQEWLDAILRKTNANRGSRVAEELSQMRELSVDQLPEYTEEDVKVSEWSTIRIKKCSYSVPSRLIYEKVRVRIYEDKLEVYYSGILQLTCEKLRGKNSHRIEYRHVIESLVRKPGAFSRYVYKEEMFPSITFRKAYDVLQVNYAGTKGDLEYLRILYLAARTMESEVEQALYFILIRNEIPSSENIKIELVAKNEIEIPSLFPIIASLTEYDNLLKEVMS